MEAISEENLAARIENMYAGELVTSNTRKSFEIDVHVTRLNNLMVRVEFSLHGQTIAFKGMLTSNDEGVLMIVQEKLDSKFLLNGMSGFMYERPNIHGGFVARLDGFYFHIVISQMAGNFEELYFFGKKRDASDKSSEPVNKHS